MKRIINIFIFIGVFVTTLVFLDIFIKYSRIESSAKTEIDLKGGKVLKPNHISVYFNEGFYIGKPNSYGFYGPDYSVIKPEGTFRVALAGDSYIAGIQLFEKFHFRRLFEDRLKDSAGKNIEVLNFGRAGFDFDDMYCRYKSLITKFTPDITIFFLAEKDLINKNKDPLLLQCRLNKDDSLVIDNDFENKSSYKQYKKMEFFINNSLIVKLLNNCNKYYKKGEAPRILFDKFYFPSVVEKKSNQTERKKHELSKLNKKIFEDLSGKNVIVVSRKELPNALLSYLDELKIKHYDLYPVFEEMKAGGVDPFYWNSSKESGHWNYDAHENVAEFLEKILLNYIKEQ